MSKFLDYEGLKVLKDKNDEIYLQEEDVVDITQLARSSSLDDSDLLVKGLSSTGDLYSITISDFLRSVEEELLQGTVKSVTTGSANGTISVDGNDVPVAGLGSAAYTESSAYATSSQGKKADSAVQSVTTGNSNGTILVDGTSVAIKGLGSAAYTDSSAYDASGLASSEASKVLGSSSDSAGTATVYGALALAQEASNKSVEITSISNDDIDALF